MQTLIEYLSANFHLEKRYMFSTNVEVHSIQKESRLIRPWDLHTSPTPVRVTPLNFRDRPFHALPANLPTRVVSHSPKWTRNPEPHGLTCFRKSKPTQIPWIGNFRKEYSNHTLCDGYISMPSWKGMPQSGSVDRPRVST